MVTLTVSSQFFRPKNAKEPFPLKNQPQILHLIVTILVAQVVVSYQQRSQPKERAMPTIEEYVAGVSMFEWHLAYQQTEEFKADEAAQVAIEVAYMNTETYRQSQRDGSRRYRDANPKLVLIRQQASKHKPMLYEQQQGKCYHCDRLMGDDCELDHIMPLIKGGTNDMNNLCVCHPQEGHESPCMTDTTYLTLLHDKGKRSRRRELEALRETGHLLKHF